MYRPIILVDQCVNWENRLPQCILMEDPEIQTSDKVLQSKQ